MIKKITVSKVASYKEEPVILDGLTKISFFFGSNGTGKTTLSKIIQSPESYPSCGIEWEDGTPLQTLVYNRYFKEKSLTHPNGIPGVFTLGENHSDTLRQIENLETEKTTLDTKLIRLIQVLNGSDDYNGKRKDLFELEDEFKESCWKQKTIHDISFTKVFEGVRNSKENFKAQILAKTNANTNTNTSTVQLDSLQSKYREVFQEELVKENEVPLIETTAIVEIQNDPLLKRVIVGRDDIDIATLINRLKSSDWVKEGYDKYYPESGGICPFFSANDHRKTCRGSKPVFR